MSKSYGRYKTIGICYGSNTQYYRDRARSFRHKNRQIIRNIIANKNIEDFDDQYIDFRQPRKDDWDEPTDGTWKLNCKYLKNKKSKNRFNGIYPTKNNKIKK